MPRMEVRSFETALAPGETCLLYADGVTEARGGPLGGDMFGEQRLADALTECVGMPAEAVVSISPQPSYIPRNSYTEAATAQQKSVSAGQPHCSCQPLVGDLQLAACAVREPANLRRL